MGNRDRDRLRRSNMVLIGLVVLMLLYGVIMRVQSGDKSLYLFGFKIDLPFATQQEAEQPEAEQTIEVEEPAQN
jgi:cytochrome b561